MKELLANPKVRAAIIALILAVLGALGLDASGAQEMGLGI